MSEKEGCTITVTDTILLQARSEAEHRLGEVDKRIRKLRDELQPLEAECEQLKSLLKFLTSRQP